MSTASSTSPPPTGREAKHADERARLHRAGWAVMRRNGYANAGINDILAEAKLGTRAFYRHFASKDDLLLAMFTENAEVTRQRVVERVEQAGSPLDRVRTWIATVLDLGYDPRHGELARIFASPTVTAVLEGSGREIVDRLIEPLRDALRDGVAAGEFPDCDPDNDAATIHAIAWRLTIDAIHERSSLPRDAAVDHVERFALTAIGATR